MGVEVQGRRADQGQSADTKHSRLQPHPAGLHGGRGTELVVRVKVLPCTAPPSWPALDGALGDSSREACW